MTMISQESSRRTRPGSGVAVDPRRVMAMRMRRGLKRWQVSGRVTELAMTDDHGDPVTLGRDHLGKIETGHRKPSLDMMKALCIVLECTSDDLMPGGPAISIPVTAKARQSRLDHNRELRAFAIEHSLRYKNPGTGRVYYSKPLREAYAAHVDARMMVTAGPEAAAAATRTANEALHTAITAIGLPEDGQDERLVS